ncbi:pyridoxamine 5'-phosphate oxidase family protein [uncultured Roseibium sp.]|uniref:FAD-binding oxidoreductase n=1 Tax=uncultured Roseibium sp. TaxID=1936171 RepID=UPI00260CF539|nr:pyridoxamine 5'-phosphate oxidase family protein [uncultured Roseibium sp.]
MLKTDIGFAADSGRSPFHKGEQQVQQHMGERDIERWAKGAIRNHMPDQHREFFEAQPFLIVSARDRQGRPWATVLEGDTGFVASPEATRLDIDASPTPGDPLAEALRAGTNIGILGIELATRRRNRVNGHVVGGTEGQLNFVVGQSFGNCPQYIRERSYWWHEGPLETRVQRGQGLTPSQIDWIRTADTFFIATGYQGEGEDPAYGMDASHRGGEKGFVEVLGDRKIRFPDYAGNRFYNTLGNIVQDGRAGFLFLDFASGSLLQLTGRATIDFGSEDVRRFAGARQLVTLDIEDVVETTAALRLRWQADAENARSLRLIEKHLESEDVVSFLFEARDGGTLEPFMPGQHLPIELKIPGFDEKVQRTYSLSNSSNGMHYRISVKRETSGLASRYLHDALQPGAILESRKPAGDFILPDDDRPIVLVSAGIGITPMLSMVHWLVESDDNRAIWFVHGARNGAHHPFKRDVDRIASESGSVSTLTFYSRPNEGDEQGRDFDVEGRISGEALKALVARNDVHYLLCGPAAFLAGMQAELEHLGVPEALIHSETF